MRKRISGRISIAALTLWAVTMMPFAAFAQTQVRLPKNKYKVQDDVKLGRDAAAQVEKQFPLLNNGQVEQYIDRVGARLVSSIPTQFRQPAFNYRFEVVNASDINAFALPGGPMYVNRGMIEAARNEGEIAGVMAHEISHIALRHATAQATETQKFQIGSILGQIAGAVIGGGVGQIIGAGSQIGFGIGALKYSRDYERQADILGARIMADAGYDPRDLANMFRTIERESGGGRGPDWLSSHPNPGDRNENINREASLLQVASNPIKVTTDFRRTQERLRSLPPARSLAEIQRGQGSTAGSTTGRYSNSVPFPSARTRLYSNGSVRLSVPSNWQEYSGQDALTFAPAGAYGDQGITRGAMLGVYRSGGGLSQASSNYVNGILQANPYLRQESGFSRASIGGRSGLATVLSGRSPVTGRTEIVTVYTMQLRDGNLMYVATVAPQNEAARYNSAFRNMLGSLRVNG